MYTPKFRVSWTIEPSFSTAVTEPKGENSQLPKEVDQSDDKMPVSTALVMNDRNIWNLLNKEKNEFIVSSCPEHGYSLSDLIRSLRRSTMTVFAQTNSSKIQANQSHDTKPLETKNIVTVGKFCLDARLIRLQLCGYIRTLQNTG